MHLQNSGYFLRTAVCGTFLESPISALIPRSYIKTKTASGFSFIAALYLDLTQNQNNNVSLSCFCVFLHIYTIVDVLSSSETDMTYKMKKILEKCTIPGHIHVETRFNKKQIPTFHKSDYLYLSIKVIIFSLMIRFLFFLALSS